TNGTPSANAMTTNTWYNHRGLVVKVSPPGGLVTKTAYEMCRQVRRALSARTFSGSTVIEQNKEPRVAAVLALVLINGALFFALVTVGGWIALSCMSQYLRQRRLKWERTDMTVDKFVNSLTEPGVSPTLCR